MIDFNELKREQLKLSEGIILNDKFDKIEKIAGIDQSSKGDLIVSCIVVCDKNMKIIETQTASVKALVPYKPGFLSYREMPAMVEAYSNLTVMPDLILVDGHGILHPRKFGIASHFGLAVGRPTIGIARHLLVGEAKEGKVYYNDELLGFEMKTKEHARPIYVSPGHMISRGTALKIAMDCMREPHKLPEPLHYAHRCAKRALNELAHK